MFITATPVTAINNTFGLPTSEFPYDLPLVLYYHIDTLPVKDICSDSILTHLILTCFSQSVLPKLKKY